MAGTIALAAATAGAGTAAAATGPTPSPTPSASSNPAGSGTRTGTAKATPAVITATESAASAKAKHSGKPVAVEDQTTDVSQVLANPDGTYTKVQYFTPQRVKRSGAWTPVDNTLVKRADGTLAPSASESSVVFSGGGDKTAVTVSHGAQKLQLKWPTALPAPTLSGPTATYADVLPGVDLRLTATATAYQEVLVVHDAKAAADPGLKALPMTLTGTNLKVRADGDGTVSTLDPSGAEVFRSAPPEMWDSSSDPRIGPDPTADDPGSGHQSLLAVTATQGVSSGSSDLDLTLKPPTSALTGPGVRYPLYIDPIFSYKSGYWASISNLGYNTYNSGNFMRVGYCGWSGCNYDVLRSYLAVDTSYLTRNGVHASVTNSTLYVTSYHSASCSLEPTELWSAGSVSSSLTWANQYLGAREDTESSRGGTADVCSPASTSPAFNDTPQIQQAANGAWPTTVMALKAPDETSSGSCSTTSPTASCAEWKQFWASGTTYAPHLDTIYNFPPGGPSQASLNIDRAVLCTGTAYVSTTGSTGSLTLHAQGTDNNPSGSQLRYFFQTYNGFNVAGSKIEDPYGFPVPQTSGVANFTTGATSAPNNWTNGAQYSYRSTDEVEDTSSSAAPVWAFTGAVGDNGTNYSASIAQAPWYNFITLTQPPPSTPAVSSFDFPQDADGNAQWGAPVGYGGRFQVTDPDPNLAGLQYAVDNNSFSAIPTTDCGVKGTAGRVPISGGTAYIPIPTNVTFGAHTMYVRAFDQAHQASTVAAYPFLLSPDDTLSAFTNIAAGKTVSASNNVGGSWDMAHLTDGVLAGGGSDDGWAGKPPTNTAANTVSTQIDLGAATTVGEVDLYPRNETPATTGYCFPQDFTIATSTDNSTWTTRVTRTGYARPGDGPQRFSFAAVSARYIKVTATTLTADPSGNYYFELKQITAYAGSSNPNMVEGEAEVGASGTAYNPAALAAPTVVTGAGLSDGAQLAWTGQAADGSGNPTSWLNLPFTVPGSSTTSYSLALGIKMATGPNAPQVGFAYDGATNVYNPLRPSAMGFTNGVYDLYSATPGSVYLPLGGVTLSGGPHILTIEVHGKNGSSSGYGVGVDEFNVAPYRGAIVASFTDSLNNHGLSDDNVPADYGTANLDRANVTTTADGWSSLSKQALNAVGLVSGKAFSLDGITFKLPTWTSGAPDNTVAMGQTITLDPAQQVRANAVGLLVASVDGTSPASSMTIGYGSGGAPTVVPYSDVRDWCAGPSSSAAYVAAYWNTTAGKGTTSGCQPRLYLVVLPVAPIFPVTSITLSNSNTLHVLGIGVRQAAAANGTLSADASAGAAHPLTLSGAVGFDNVGHGGGGAAVFDGYGGYGATAVKVLDTTHSFSVSAWVKAAQITSGTVQTMVVQQGSTASAFALQTDGTHWKFTRSDTDSTNPVIQSAVSNSAADTQWHHLVGTWDTGGTMTLYVDGVAQTTTGTEHTATAFNGPVVIGRGYVNGQAANPFTGEIADVQVYPRTLSAADVTALTNSAMTSDLTSPSGTNGASGWWQLADFGRNWVGVWAAQPTGAAPGGTPSLAGTTIRQVVHPSELGYATVNTIVNGNGGTENAGDIPEIVPPVQTRIRLSNAFGTTPLTIDAASLAAQTSAGTAATGQATTITFNNNNATVTINPGAEVVSDPVTLPNTSGGSGNLVVSLAVDAGTGTVPYTSQLTSPAYPVYQAGGNQTGDTVGAPATWSTPGGLTGRYILSGLDVTDVVDPVIASQTGTSPGTIAVLGDQVAGNGNPATWLDAVAADGNVYSPAGGTNPGGFVNLSTAGATVAGADSQFSASPNTTVLDEPNLRAVVVTLGLNDLKGGGSASAIETNLNTLISSLTPYGITNHYGPDGTQKVDVYIATIPDDSSLTPAQETERASLNTCITSQGATCAVKILFGGTSTAGAASGVLDIAGAVGGLGSSPTRAQINSAIDGAVASSTMNSVW